MGLGEYLFIAGAISFLGFLGVLLYLAIRTLLDWLERI